MFSHILVKREWITSPAAQRVYRWAAVTEVVFLAAFGLAVTETGGINDLIATPAGHVAYAVLFLGGALSVAALELAMLVYWFRYDESGGVIRAISILAMLLLVNFGVLLYYAAKYRRDMGRQEPRAMGATAG